MRNIIARALEWLGKTFIAPIRDGLRKLNKKLDPFFDTAWTAKSLLGKLSTVFSGLFSLVFGFISLFFAISNFGSLVDIVKGTVQGSDFWLQKLENIIKGYPSFQSLVTSMDANFSGLGNFFSPPLTFTRILQVTGIGDAFNSIVVCAVQGIGFVISLRLLFWSLARVNIQMVKPVK